MSTNPLFDLLSPADKQLLIGGGQALVNQLGIEVIQDVIINVLMGKNLRDSTEKLTRKRTAALNLALVSMFIKGSSESPEFIEQLPHLAAEVLARPRTTEHEKWVARWLIGMTGKGTQNVLRDNHELFETYTREYIETCKEVIANHINEHGNLSGYIDTSNGERITIDWQFLTYLLNTVGAETLTIRGSDKSSNGKLFEKLVLGS